MNIRRSRQGAAAALDGEGGRHIRLGQPAPPFGSCPGEGGRAKIATLERVLECFTSPIGASGIFVYPAGSTQSALQPDERRRSRRLTTSSIVLVHLGPDNGGIVINLSVDGVSCQAAMRLGLQAGTQLNVRLRGSGLNVEALGELVWIGAKQKEVGIRFENIPEKTRQEIAGWIDQQRKPRQASFLDEPSPLKPMSAMPGISAPRDKTTPHSLTAALGMSGEKYEDPLASLGADEDESRLSALLDSEADTSAAQHLEIVPPPPELQDSSSLLESTLVSEHENLATERSHALAVPPAPIIERNVHGVPLLELPAAEAPPVLPAASLEAVERAQEAAPPEPPADRRTSKVSAGPLAGAEPYKMPALKAAPQPVGSWLARHLPEFPEVDVERWVPPALLDAWNGGTPRHRLLLAGGATLSLGFFAVLLVLAASHSVGSGASPAGGTNDPSAPPPVVAPGITTSGAADASRVSPLPQIQQLRIEQRNAPRPAPAPEQPQKPEATPLEKFAKLFVGSDTENPDDAPPPPLPQIREDQLGVEVWISKTSGYFYCTDDPYFKTVNPGALMPQGDALQNGYRPILNQFCD